ncbi:serine/threonine-protein kinase [Arthrobacter sp. 35W]|uniref:serine/threonine-protein kinase n=1 Tax=Arthrobacter sp. 35W TaxID=1132441 RepID=UPI00040F0A13|nr:serine/threonine-protein kinase [Arthrobacter sp. 35W]
MSTKRPPAAPPHIPGYSYVSLLGSGGFSDVFLYEQERPRRKVAVKVLVADLKTDGARRRFESEANLMAQLSTHPYIVTIYEAEVTDAGHSYLAMEYCSRPSLDTRYRKARFSVDEVLAVGIQVASAVETAHRAGIAHRDIKPANILVTDYNRPALTDFGISGTTDGAADEDAGMSIPWSPPESFTGASTDGVLVDVWALGATLYTLLAGRSPFVVPGASNSQRELINRISTAPLPGLGRADVPQSLELVLATAMAKSPASRYASAQAFARALMRVQSDLNLSVTPFEMLDDSAPEEHPAEENQEATRVRSIVSIDPDAATNAPTFPTRFPGTAGAFGAGNTTTGRTGTTAAGTTGRGATGPTTPVDYSTGATAPGEGTVPRPGLVRSPHEWAQPMPRDAASEDSVLASTVHRSAAPAAAGPRGFPGAGPGTDAGAQGSETHPPRRSKLWLGIGAGVVLAGAAAVGIAVVATGGTPTQEAATTTAAPPPPAIVAGAEVPAVADLKATAQDGGATWTWTNPDPKEGDSYLWSAVSVVDGPQFKPIGTASVFVTNNAQGVSCIDVVLVRKNGATSPDTKKCYPD